MDRRNEIEKLYNDIYKQYPTEFHTIIRNNEKRIRWQVEVVLKHVPENGKLIDIGGGIVPFMYICQKLGYETIVVDDMEDDTYKLQASKIVLNLFDRAGVKFVKGDAFSDVVADMGSQKFDLITSHDSMEHWHNSPKKLFHKLWDTMKDGALFWIGVPNCVNLRKRITVPFGKGKWSQMKDWYEPDVFRGHVREPDVGDLRYIAKDLGASRIEIIGRNWTGYRHSSVFIRSITPFIDRGMQLFPSVCSDIYLFAWK